MLNFIRKESVIMEYIVTGKKCFDGCKILTDFYFHVVDGKIIDIGSLKDLDSKGVDVIDFGNHLVTPGLMDAHIHICMNPYQPKFEVTDLAEIAITAERNLNTLLHNGITYVRDVGAPAGIMKTLKRLVENGTIIGPDLKICGQAICATGGHGWQMSKESNSVNDVCKYVRENVKEGVDQIKLMVTGGINTKGNELAPLELTKEEIQVAVNEAHRRGRKVCVHTHGRTGIETCLKCGVDSIEHGLLMDEELANLAKENGTWLVPTLSAPYFAVAVGLKKDPNSKSHLKSKEVMEVHRKNALYAYKTGVKMAMGTDSGTPFNGFDTVLEELVLLNKIGITNEDVFKMATSNASELLEVSSTDGTLEVGKNATFVVFEKDPLENIEDVHEIHCVYKKGELVK